MEMQTGKRQATTAAFGRLLSGSGLGYAIVLAFSPLLTRLYSPNDFGTFAVFGALVAVGSIFATMSFELGILSARRASGAFRFAGLAVASLTVMTVAALALLLLSMTLGLQPPLENWVLVSAIASCAFAALTSIGINWAIRRERAGIAAGATFVSLGGRSAGQAALGFMLGGLPGLVLGELLGRVAGWLAVERGILRHAVRSTLARTRKVRDDFTAEIVYPLYTTPGIALDTALVWLPAPLFALYFDPAAGGFIALVQRIGSAPLTIANQSLGQLFHRRASQMVDTKPGSVVRFVLIVLLLTLPPALGLGVVLWIWGESLAGFVLGRYWGPAGFVALAFLPLFYLQFLSLMTNRLILIQGNMRLKLVASATHITLIWTGCMITSALGMGWEAAVIIVPGILALSHLAVMILVLAMLARHSVEKC